jgi:hypothetical protein
MIFFYLAKIALTDFIYAGIRRHSKIAPPSGFIGSLGNLLALLPPPRAETVLFVLLLTRGLLFFREFALTGRPALDL